MQFVDWIILIAIAAVAVSGFAIKMIRKKKGKGCCGTCDKCKGC